MKIHGGYYIKARKIKDSWIAQASPCVRETWDYLLREANHKDQKYSGFEVKRGQLFRSFREIRDDLKWSVGYRFNRYSENEMKHCMKLLRTHQMITLTSTPRGNLITVLQYSLYQDHKNYESTNESTNEPTNRKPSINRQQLSINKNDKNERKDIIEDNEKNIEIVDKPQTHKDFSFDHLEKAIEDKNEMYLYLVDKFALQRPDIGKAGARKELQKFCDFYGATSYGSKKRHWQKQKTFSVPLRLRTWFENVRVTKEYQEELEREKTKRMTEYYSNLSNNNQNG